jgi:glyoxylase-like metal-dependent hydrolase (beta-lactamase superfamily II)
VIVKRHLTILTLLVFVGTELRSQSQTYDVYAIQFGGEFRFSANEIAVKASKGDSVTGCYMIWLLKNSSGRNILVDAGFTDTVKHKTPNYIRPDKALEKINIKADDISDIILTHPHWDHIGGLSLFPKAKVWIQKIDYEYFVGRAWQPNGFSDGFEKSDVRKIVDVNLDGRLRLVEGDNVEIIPGIKVFIGSKHTFESQYVLVDTKKGLDKVILASDNIWFYYNLLNLVPIPKYTFDPDGYVREMRRMKTLVSNENLIIPGHDATVFDKFPQIVSGIVKIEQK